MIRLSFHKNNKKINFSRVEVIDRRLMSIRHYTRCGLDGKKYSRMYAMSKWMKKDQFSGLELNEFQWVIERFSSPLRLDLHGKVQGYMAEHGYRFQHTIDEVSITDNVNNTCRLANSPSVTCRSARAAMKLEWDEIFNRISDVRLPTDG